jgi:integrase
MPTVPRITKTAVDALTPVAGRPVYLWDASLSGFGVKCSPGGMKRYLIKYRTNGGGRSSPQRWFTLGSHGQLTPDQARKMAQKALAAVAQGDDPQGNKLKDRAAATLEAVWERFKVEHLPARKPQTRYEYEAQWTSRLRPALGRARVAQISRSDVDKLHKKLHATPYRANRILALLSRLMTLAEVWELRAPGSNPCRHIQRFAETPRNRYLSNQELTALGTAMALLIESDKLSLSAANAIQLLLLTGARVTELLSAEWAWVDTDRGVIALPDSKTGAKPIFLSQAAVAVLRRQADLSKASRFVFPGTGKTGRMIDLGRAWSKVCQAAGLTRVRLHDLRHTAASIAVGQGASLPIIGRLLGHTQAQTTLRYAHVDSDPALLAANAVGEVVEHALQLGVRLSKRRLADTNGAGGTIH